MVRKENAKISGFVRRIRRPLKRSVCVTRSHLFVVGIQRSERAEVRLKAAQEGAFDGP